MVSNNTEQECQLKKIISYSITLNVKEINGVVTYLVESRKQELDR